MDDDAGNSIDELDYNRLGDLPENNEVGQEGIFDVEFGSSSTGVEDNNTIYNSYGTTKDTKLQKTIKMTEDFLQNQIRTGTASKEELDSINNNLDLLRIKNQKSIRNLSESYDKSIEDKSPVSEDTLQGGMTLHGFNQGRVSHLEPNEQLLFRSMLEGRVSGIDEQSREADVNYFISSNNIDVKDFINSINVDKAVVLPKLNEFLPTMAQRKIHSMLTGGSDTYNRAGPLAPVAGNNPDRDNLDNEKLQIKLIKEDDEFFAAINSLGTIADLLQTKASRDGPLGESRKQSLIEKVYTAAQDARWYENLKKGQGGTSGMLLPHDLPDIQGLIQQQAVWPSVGGTRHTTMSAEDISPDIFEQDRMGKHYRDYDGYKILKEGIDPAKRAKYLTSLPSISNTYFPIKGMESDYSPERWKSLEAEKRYKTQQLVYHFDNIRQVASNQLHTERFVSLNQGRGEGFDKSGEEQANEENLRNEAAILGKEWGDIGEREWDSVSQRDEANAIQTEVNSIGSIRLTPTTPYPIDIGSLEQSFSVGPLSASSADLAKKIATRVAIEKIVIRGSNRELTKEELDDGVTNYKKMWTNSGTKDVIRFHYGDIDRAGLTFKGSDQAGLHGYNELSSSAVFVQKGLTINQIIDREEELSFDVVGPRNDRERYLKWVEDTNPPKQNTPEWYRGRKGYTTASGLDELFSTDGYVKEAIRLIEEKHTVQERKFDGNSNTQEGKDGEDKAIRAFMNSVDGKGLILEEAYFKSGKDIGLPYLGASPDGLLFNEDGSKAAILEVKTKKSSTINNSYNDYHLQTQLQMLVHEFDKAFLFSLNRETGEGLTNEILADKSIQSEISRLGLDAHKLANGLDAKGLQKLRKIIRKNAEDRENDRGSNRRGKGVPKKVENPDEVFSFEPKSTLPITEEKTAFQGEKYVEESKEKAGNKEKSENIDNLSNIDAEPESTDNVRGKITTHDGKKLTPEYSAWLEAMEAAETRESYIIDTENKITKEREEKEKAEVQNEKNLHEVMAHKIEDAIIAEPIDKAHRMLLDERSAYKEVDTRYESDSAKERAYNSAWTAAIKQDEEPAKIAHALMLDERAAYKERDVRYRTFNTAWTAANKEEDDRIEAPLKEARQVLAAKEAEDKKEESEYQSGSSKKRAYNSAWTKAIKEDGTRGADDGGDGDTLNSPESAARREDSARNKATSSLKKFGASTNQAVSMLRLFIKSLNSLTDFLDEGEVLSANAGLESKEYVSASNYLREEAGFTKPQAAKLLSQGGDVVKRLTNITKSAEHVHSMNNAIGSSTINIRDGKDIVRLTPEDIIDYEELWDMTKDKNPLDYIEWATNLVNKGNTPLDRNAIAAIVGLPMANQADNQIDFSQMKETNQDPTVTENFTNTKQAIEVWVSEAVKAAINVVFGELESWSNMEASDRTNPVPNHGSNSEGTVIPIGKEVKDYKIEGPSRVPPVPNSGMGTLPGSDYEGTAIPSKNMGNITMSNTSHNNHTKRPINIEVVNNISPDLISTTTNVDGQLNLDEEHV